jgi:hypothetical protein
MLRSMFRSLARGLIRRPSPARKASQPRRCQPLLEELECRLTPTVSVSILNGVLTAQCDSGANTVTVDHVVVAGKGFAQINNGHLFSDASYSSIQVIGGAGGTVTDVHGNVKPLTVLGDSSKDVVNLGDASNKVQGIQGTVLVEDEHGFSSTLNINDQGDTTGRTVALSTVPRPKDTSLGQVSGLGAAAIQWDYHDTAAVNLHLGVGASQVNVQGTGVTTNIFNSADATIEVGNGGLAGIHGALSLDNDGGIDRLFIDDFNDQHGQIFTFDRITGDDFFNTFEQITSGVFGPAGSITFDNADVSSMVFTAGNGGNLFNVNRTGTATTINGGTGGNTFEVGSGNLGSDIQGQLVLHGGGNPLTAMSLLDQNNPNIETYNFNFFLPGSADLTLGSNLLFDLVFTDMLNFVDLSTNGNPLDTVTAPPGAVNVF